MDPPSRLRESPPMRETDSSEVERVLLHVGNAADRARRAAVHIAKAEGEPHVVKALEDAADELRGVYRQLAQATYYAVPGDV